MNAVQHGSCPQVPGAGSAGLAARPALSHPTARAIWGAAAIRPLGPPGRLVWQSGGFIHR